MNRAPYFSSFRQGTRSGISAAQPTKGAADFLQAHGQMATLLPAITRIAALQKDCTTILPTLFDACTVLHFQSGQLILSTPTTALAAKLKQQLPKLQNGLLKLNWQVSSVKIKVQPGNSYHNVTKSKELLFTQTAMSAFATLTAELEESPRNKALKAAIDAMLQRQLKGNKANR
jgi:hypothetical protein